MGAAAAELVFVVLAGASVGVALVVGAAEEVGAALVVGAAEEVGAASDEGSGATLTGATATEDVGAADLTVVGAGAGAAEEVGSSSSSQSSSSSSAVAVGWAALEETLLAGLHSALRFFSRVSPFFKGWQQASKKAVLCCPRQLIAM